MSFYKVKNPEKVAEALVQSYAWNALKGILSEYFTDLTGIYVYVESDGAQIVYISVHSDKDCRYKNFKIDLTLPKWAAAAVSVMTGQRSYYNTMARRDIDLGHEPRYAMPYPYFKSGGAASDYLVQHMQTELSKAHIPLSKSHLIVAMGQNEFAWAENVCVEVSDPVQSITLSLDGYIVKNDISEPKMFVAGFEAIPFAPATDELGIMDDFDDDLDF